MAGNMIITSAHSSHDGGVEEVHCPFPGPHSQPYTYSGYTASCLGKAHLVCGAVCVVLEILGLGVDLENHRAAPGIWCGLLCCLVRITKPLGDIIETVQDKLHGNLTEVDYKRPEQAELFVRPVCMRSLLSAGSILFICAGVISMVCGKRNTKDWIKSNLVAALVASIFATGPLINCSLAMGNFGSRFLCWMLMAATTAELIVALSTVVICVAAIWPQYFQLFGIQMMASAPPQPAGRVADTFQVMYVPPTNESDPYPNTQPGPVHGQHPQTLSVDPGLRPPTCVVIPPTPSPPPGTDDDSPSREHQAFRRT